MTREKYFTMMEQLGQEPKEHEIPPDGEDLPEIAVDAINTFNLLNVSQFDLFVKTAADIFKVTGCVITNGSFRIERSGLLSIDIEGDAEKVQRGQSLTGSLRSRSATKN